MSIDLSRPSSSFAGEDYDSLLEDNSDGGPSRAKDRTQRSDMLLSDETDDADDQAQMDLVLNTNFDLGLFDYNWPDESTNNNNTSIITTTNETNVCDNTAPELRDTNCDDEILTSCNVPSGTSCTPMNTLHPQAIQSSADCPPIDSSTVLLHLSNDTSGVEQSSRDNEIARRDKTSTTENTQALAWRNDVVSSYLTDNTVSTLPATNNNTCGSFSLSGQLQSLAPIANSTVVTSGTPGSQQPPFLLFDAPIELRANFIASQRAHGFPILDDNNSFHYDHTPQIMQQQMCAPAVNLVDGRHGGIRNKRVKNEREQKRTQKITDLIEQLREKMEEGGWKVGGAKSKYATLSTCAEYVKHLVKATKEQELALEKTKKDLEAKRRKIEDDCEYQQDPSDPESTISSLTVSSNSTSFQNGRTSPIDTSSKKRSMTAKNPTHSKKTKIMPTYIEEKNERSMSSSSSASNVCSENLIRLDDINRDDAHAIDDLSNSTRSEPLNGVSSVGAVAPGFQSSSHRDKGSVEIGNGIRNRSVVVETTSMDSSFKLDYEEVFVKSSVPQLLATTAGKIVAWNDIFLKASGLLTTDIDSLTIFSLVRQTELIKLFEIVAATLRSGSMMSDGSDGTPPALLENSNVAVNEKAVPITNYTAITLPCTSFRTRHITNRSGEIEVLDELLYMTVTLMADRDPKKRCFHCVFTNSPGTNGALGSVTPKLLSVLFTNQNKTISVDSE